MDSQPILPPIVSCGSYQPVVGGVELVPETGNPDATFANLETLMMETTGPDGHRTPVRSIVKIIRRDGNVIVMFDTAEVYVGIGFDGTPHLREFQRRFYPLDLDMEDAIFRRAI